jgi:hypothetical protein
MVVHVQYGMYYTCFRIFLIFYLPCHFLLSRNLNLLFRGLCQAAVAHPDRNRYCNLYPFDSNRVILQTTSEASSLGIV